MSYVFWIYQTRPWSAFLAAFVLLYCLSYVGFRLGAKARRNASSLDGFDMPEAIPSTIIGMLALILGFSFSMAVQRFENRRQLAIEEANAISSTYSRATLLRSAEGARIPELLKRYVDARIDYYEVISDPARLAPVVARISGIQEEIRKSSVEATRQDRGAIESIFILSLNSMENIRNERNFALSKTLPIVIYWSILLIAGIGLIAFNFALGERGQRGYRKCAILVLVISLLFYLILDLDRPQAGLIQISQDAMIALRQTWGR